MPSVKLYGSSLIRHRYSDKYSKPKYIIESVYDLVWRLSPNSHAFLRDNGVRERRGGMKLQTDVAEILHCMRHGTSPLYVDNDFTTFTDSSTIKGITYNKPSRVKRAILDSKDMNDRLIGIFGHYTHKWVTLSAYIFPYIYYIGKMDDGERIVELRIPNHVIDKVLPIINEGISDVFELYRTQSKEYCDKPPIPELDDTIGKQTHVTFRMNCKTDRITTIFYRWVYFMQLLYRKGAIGYNHNSVPTEILTGTDDIRNLFIKSLCRVTALKSYSEHECGLFKERRRSMTISMKLLFEQTGIPYKLIETVNKGVYNSEIYTTIKRGFDSKDQNLASISMEGDGIGTLNEDMFDVTLDGDEIWVDGIVIPFHN